MRDNIVFWGFLDMDESRNLLLLVAFRIILSCTLTWNSAHPDHIFQGTQVAYNMVYGGVDMAWEFTPQWRLRNALYPTFLAVPLYAMKWLGIDSGYAVLMQPYLTHSLLVLAYDLAFWKATKKYAGKEVAQLMMFFNIFGFNQNILLH